MATPIGVIKKFVETLVNTNKTGTDAADEAFKALGAGTYNAFKSKFSSDRSSYSTYQDFLEQACGVRLNNQDTGAITGSDAGGKTTKTDDSIVPENSAAKELKDAEYNSFTKNGLKVNVTYASGDGGSNFNYDSENYLAKQKLVVRALYNWWIPESLDLIDESLGINFTDGRANINEINVEFANSYNYYLGDCMEIECSYDMGRASNVTLIIGTSVLSNMTADDKNGTLESGKTVYSTDMYGGVSHVSHKHLDQLILQAMAEITLKANVPYVQKLPTEIRGALAAIVGGYDSTASYSTYATGFSEIAGYAQLRYLAKNYSGLPAGLSYNSDKTVLTATADFIGNEIDLAEYESSVKTVNVSALTKGVNIIANTLANSLVGGKGADTLSGGAGNDTLTGGAGNDVFIYTNGKDVITDYTAGDKISLGSYDKASVKGSDVIFTVGKGSLTVKNFANKTITFTDGTTYGGNNSDTTPADSTTLTLTNKDDATVTLGSSYENADASKRTKAIKIFGNSKNNSIVGTAKNDSLNGAAGNDTLHGAAGNDTLTGGAGNDVFIYTNGKDVITDYSADDKIKISAGAIKSSTVKGSDVIFTVGKGSLTVNDAAGKTLSMIDSAGKNFSTVVGGSEPADDSATLILTNSDKAVIELDFDTEIVDASARTKAIKIFGNEQNNFITGSSKNDFIDGSDGDDTLRGGEGNDTLEGGDGDDLFVYTNGKDVIADYEVGDKISLAERYSKAEVKKSNVVFTIGKGTLTVKDAADKIITFDDGTTFGGETATLTLTNSDKSPVTLESGMEIADASARTKAIKIFGNDLDNTIIGGKGADTLYGAAGNDSLWGGGGADIFLCVEGEGDDVIGDFGEDDMLLITGSFSASYKKSSGEIAFKLGDGSLTLKNFSAETFNINGLDYQISGTKLARK